MLVAVTQGSRPSLQRELATSDSCSATPRRLSSECGGVCASHYPCLVYNASVDCDDCEVDEEEECEYFCIEYAKFPSLEEFVLLVPFSSYESSQEAAAREADSDFEEEVGAMGDDTDDYYHISNSAVTQIGALTLDDSTTQFTLAGGDSATDAVKSKVAMVAFTDSDLISEQTNITNVTIHSFNLLAVIDSLPSMLPSTVTRLDLVNTLLTSFPSQFSALSALNTL
ncbi:hypothetical protein BBJ28_00020321 [Nothophytophthora sp. Chile5]|nr:hypothetical protein BBJ28_00020321 [Nothophytophthora sp. Chile5]